jgi:hypothetical protein
VNLVAVNCKGIQGPRSSFVGDRGARRFRLSYHPSWLLAVATRCTSSAVKLTELSLVEDFEVMGSSVRLVSRATVLS